MKDVKSDYVMPKMKEYNVTKIWETIQKDDEMMRYFPPCKGKNPDKSYLFKVRLLA
jgi:hypothetical protein